MNKHTDYKKATITTGPVYVPPINIFVPNDKLIVVLKNPTHKKLEAFVTLGLCPSPGNAGGGYGGGYGSGVQVHKFEVSEMEITLGWFKVDPMSCLRIEREDFFGYRNAVYRLTATGDFEICKDSCTPICGKLEISSVIGFSGYFGWDGAEAVSADITKLYSPYYGGSGVVGTDEQTHVRYSEWVVCEEHCHCASDSESHSCSDSDSASGSCSSDDHH